MSEVRSPKCTANKKQGITNDEVNSISTHNSLFIIQSNTNKVRIDTVSVLTGNMATFPMITS